MRFHLKCRRISDVSILPWSRFAIRQVLLNTLRPMDPCQLMMTSSNGNIYHVTGLLSGDAPYPVDSLHKMQWRGALMFSLICAWINGLANNRDGGHLGRQRAHYDVTVMYLFHHWLWWWLFAWFSLRNSLHFDGLMQERRNSSALAMVLRLSCTNPSICHYHFFTLNIGIGGYVKELWCSGAISQWFH